MLQIQGQAHPKTKENTNSHPSMPRHSLYLDKMQIPHNQQSKTKICAAVSRMKKKKGLTSGRIWLRHLQPPSQYGSAVNCRVHVSTNQCTDNKSNSPWCSTPCPLTSRPLQQPFTPKTLHPPKPSLRQTNPPPPWSSKPLCIAAAIAYCNNTKCRRSHSPTPTPRTSTGSTSPTGHSGVQS